MIELVNVDGNHRRVMSRARHETDLQVLTQHAQRFHRRLRGPEHEDSGHTWAINKTGTLETSELSMCKREIEQLESREVNKLTVPEEVLQVHGFAPPMKAEGTVWLIYKNINGFLN